MWRFLAPQIQQKEQKMSIKRIKIALLAFVFIGLAWHLELGNDYDGKLIQPQTTQPSES